MCVKLLTVWLAVIYITIGTRLQFHSVESHFYVCGNSLVYRSHCNFDRSTCNACLVAIATPYTTVGSHYSLVYQLIVITNQNSCSIAS